jgi:hypothetical protein
MEMTIETAKKIREQYSEADEAFRAAKKDPRANSIKLAAMKAKRDDLESQHNVAIKFLKEHNAL